MQLDSESSIMKLFNTLMKYQSQFTIIKQIVQFLNYYRIRMTTMTWELRNTEDTKKHWAILNNIFLNDVTRKMLLYIQCDIIL